MKKVTFNSVMEIYIQNPPNRKPNKILDFHKKALLPTKIDFITKYKNEYILNK